MPWSAEELAGGQIQCECGRVHHVPIHTIRSGEDVLEHLPEDVAHLGLPRRAIIVADETTYDLAGRKVVELLEADQITTEEVILRPRRAFGQRHWVLPDEHSLGQVLLAIGDEPCFLVAVGAGTINDIVRFVAHRTGKAFISVVPLRPWMGMRRRYRPCSPAASRKLYLRLTRQLYIVPSCWPLLLWRWWRGLWRFSG